MARTSKLVRALTHGQSLGAFTAERAQIWEERVQRAQQAYGSGLHDYLQFYLSKIGPIALQHLRSKQANPSAGIDTAIVREIAEANKKIALEWKLKRKEDAYGRFSNGYGASRSGYMAPGLSSYESTRTSQAREKKAGIVSVPV